MTPPAATLEEMAPAPAAVATEPPPPPPPPPPSAEPAVARAKRPVDRRTARWLGIACPVVYAVCMAIEPVPADPQAAVPVWAGLVTLISIAAIVATVASGFGRDARVFPAAVGAGVLAVGLSVACPLSGHHSGIGWWWYTQMALSVGFLAFGAAAWRRHRTAA